MEEHIQEVETPEVEETAQEETQVQAPQENEGMKFLRTERDRLSKENRDLANRLKMAEEQKKNNIPEYDPDDYVPRQYVDNELKTIKQQLQEASIKSRYPDFDKVVNDTTIALLKEKNPSLAYAIGQVGDVYSQASAAYEAIQSFGIYTPDTFQKDREVAQSNASKPKPLNAVSPQNQKTNSPLSQANAFAEGSQEYRNQLWKEMNFYRKQSQ